MVHSDVSIPILTKLMNGSRYILTFLDDYSRYFWIYFLKHTFEVVEIFKVFKVLAENTLGKKIKALKLDNGGDYIKI